MSTETWRCVCRRSSSPRVFVFFFFFQAEDGIRDVAVTGVQTCALPISVGSGLIDRPKCDGYAGTLRAAAIAAILAGSLRSEERRVGKECRSRWSPYH